MSETKTVKDLSELRQLITELQQSYKTAETLIATNVDYTDDGRRKTERVEAKVHEPSLLMLLLDGLEKVKNKIEFLQKNQEVAEDEGVMKIDQNIDDLFFSVDHLIQHRLGARRHGLALRWQFPEGIYEWFPLDKSFELRKVE